MKKVILCFMMSCCVFANARERVRELRPSLRWIIEMRDLDAQLFGSEDCDPIRRSEDYQFQCHVSPPIKGFYAYGKVKNAYGQEDTAAALGIS